MNPDNLPQPPEGVLDPKQPWWSGKVGEKTWMVLKAKLTGGEAFGTGYSSSVNLTNAEADLLIENLKKDPRGYPQMDDGGGGIRQMENIVKYQEWLEEEYLEKPFRKQVDAKIEEAAIASRMKEIEEERKKTKPQKIKKAVVVEEIDSSKVKEDEKVIEVAAQVVQQAHTDRQQQIDEKILDDLPESIRSSLANIISKKTGVKLPEAEKKSTSISNVKIYKMVSTNLVKIQSQLSSIDKGIQEHNSLLRTNLYLTASAVSDSMAQDDIVEKKLDLILDAFDRQNKLAKDFADQQEIDIAERKLETQKDASFTEGFKDTSGINDNNKSGSALPRRLLKWLYKFLPRRFRAAIRLGRMTAKKAVGKLGLKMLGKVAPRLSAAVARRGAIPLGTKLASKAINKGLQRYGLKNAFESTAKIASSKAGSMAMNSLFGGPAGNILMKQIAKPDSGLQITIKALGNTKVKDALIKKIGAKAFGKVSAKLGVKVGGQAIPVIGQAANMVYGLGEAITRTVMGDFKGGLLSLGGAIPVAGAAFSIVDIIRDIDIDAYTKHVEPNLGSIAAGDGKPVAAFFAEVSGVPVQEYEFGTDRTKPGLALLHGTEAVIPIKGQSSNTNPLNTIGGSLVAASTQFLNQAGAVAAPISPMFEQIAGKLSKIYDIPSTVAQTNIGGTIPSNLGQQIKKNRENQLSGMEKELMDAADKDPKSFAEKLMKLLDPNGTFQEILKNINNNNPITDTDTDEVELIGEGTFIQGNTGASSGDHFHIGPQEFYDTGAKTEKGKKDAREAAFKVAKALIAKKTYFQFSNSSYIFQGGNATPPDDAKLMEYIEAEQYGHATRPRGGSWGGIDIVAPKGTRLPLPVGKVSDKGGGFGNTANIVGTKGFVAHGASGSSETQENKIKTLTTTGDAPIGLGQQGVSGNKDFGATSGVGNKGYLIVPGHAAGGGAPEEKKLVKQLAKNAYGNLKSKFPDANVKYLDTDNMFEDTEEGFKKQLSWFKQKEKEGWEILEVHMDACIESGQGVGRGVIAPTGELNPVEAYFAKNYGAYSRGHRDLGAPKRGVGLFELGNVSPELEAASKQNNVTKKQLDSLTAPLEQAIKSGLNLSSSSSVQSSRNSRAAINPGPGTTGRANTIAMNFEEESSKNNIIFMGAPQQSLAQLPTKSNNLAGTLPRKEINPAQKMMLHRLYTG